MLGQPVSMLIPQVVGFRLTGELPEGATATDLVLTVTQMLRERARGRQVRRVLRPGPARTCRSPTARRSATCRPSTARRAASSRSTPRRCATWSSPGARPSSVELVEAYSRAQGLFHEPDAPEPAFSDTLRARPFDGRAEPGRAAAPAGPRRAHRRGGRLPRRAAELRQRRGLSGVGQVIGAELPGQRPAVEQGRGAVAQADAGAPAPRRPAGRARARRRRRAGPRRGRHRRDHELHEHLQPVGHARRRACSPRRPSRRAWRGGRGSRRAWRRARRSSPSTSSAPG